MSSKVVAWLVGDWDGKNLWYFPLYWMKLLCVYLISSGSILQKSRRRVTFCREKKMKILMLWTAAGRRSLFATKKSTLTKNWLNKFCPQIYASYANLFSFASKYSPTKTFFCLNLLMVSHLSIYPSICLIIG